MTCKMHLFAVGELLYTALARVCRLAMCGSKLVSA